MSLTMFAGNNNITLNCFVTLNLINNIKFVLIKCTTCTAGNSKWLQQRFDLMSCNWYVTEYVVPYCFHITMHVKICEPLSVYEEPIFTKITYIQEKNQLFVSDWDKKVQILWSDIFNSNSDDPQLRWKYMTTWLEFPQKYLKAMDGFNYWTTWTKLNMTWSFNPYW